jgi:hypothetical protein
MAVFQRQMKQQPFSIWSKNFKGGRGEWGQQGQPSTCVKCPGSDPFKKVWWQELITPEVFKESETCKSPHIYWCNGLHFHLNVRIFLKANLKSECGRGDSFHILSMPEPMGHIPRREAHKKGLRVGWRVQGTRVKIRGHVQKCQGFWETIWRQPEEDLDVSHGLQWHLRRHDCCSQGAAPSSEAQEDKQVSLITWLHSGTGEDRETAEVVAPPTTSCGMCTSHNPKSLTHPPRASQVLAPPQHPAPGFCTRE